MRDQWKRDARRMTSFGGCSSPKKEPRVRRNIVYATRFTGLEGKMDWIHRNFLCVSRNLQAVEIVYSGTGYRADKFWCLAVADPCQAKIITSDKYLTK